MSQEKINIRIQSKVDSSDKWQSNNTLLLDKEIGYERETGKYKIGDGVTRWNDLSYAQAAEVDTILKATEDGGYKIDEAELSARFSAAFGLNTRAGAKAFTIVDCIPDSNTYVLDSVEGLEVGMVYSAHIAYLDNKGVQKTAQNSNYGAITSIDSTTNKVVVDEYYYPSNNFVKLTEFVDENGFNLEYNSFRIIERPDLGTRTVGNGTFATGVNNSALSKGAVVFGEENIAAGSFSFAAGKANRPNAWCSGTIGSKNIVNGNASIAVGQGNTINSVAAFASGGNNTVDGKYASANGFKNIVSGQSASVFGQENDISGTNSIAVGLENNISKANSFAAGSNNNISANNSVAFGDNNIIQNSESGAFGYNNIVTARQSLAVGASNRVINGPNNMVIGSKLVGGRISSGGQLIIGANSNLTVDDTTPAFFDESILFGCYLNQKVAQISKTGNIAGKSTSTIGADYAEYFEWKDGNPNQEDRRGRFVALNGEHIEYATNQDDILGIVSAVPGVIGNDQEMNWQGRYLKDEFGALIYEEVIIDEEGNTEIVPMENPNYNPNMEYIPRSQRPEWAPVGFMGQIIMLQDGSCQVGDYCAPGTNGIATATIEKTNCKVMKVIDNTHILVLLK